MSALRSLLAGAIDYAGLFPPAALPMAAAVDNFDEYRVGDASWMLGRLVVPVPRLEEFEHAAGPLLEPNGGMPWRLSRNPFECSVYLDVRTVPGQTADDVKRSLRHVLRDFASARKCEEPDLLMYVNDPPTVLDAEAPLTRLMKEAHRRVTGRDSPLIIRRPGADSTHFNRYDVPCVCYGPGGFVHPDLAGGLMHSLGEHACVEHLVTAARVYLDAALLICDVDANQPR